MFTKAYLVPGGEGWTLRTFSTEGGLQTKLVRAEHLDRETSGKLRRLASIFRWRCGFMMRD